RAWQLPAPGHLVVCSSILAETAFNNLAQDRQHNVDAHERALGSFLHCRARSTISGVMNPRRFFVELKRRNVYRAAVLYGMSAWLLAQITTQIFPFFNVPNSAVRFVIVALAAGFPIAMVLAWVYELTPEGFVRTEDVDLAKQRGFGRKVDFVIIGVLLLVIAMLVYQRLPFRTESGQAILEKSIAVLPFANLSDEKANAFFADGVQDDILTSLAKIKDLRVISRSSVMQFRDVATRN